MWLFTFSLNLAKKTFEIPTRYNCTYQQRDILRALTFLKPRSRIRRRRPKKSIKNAPTRQPTQKKQQHSQRRHTPFAPQTNKPPKSQKHAMQTQPTSPSSYKNQRSLQKESHGCHRPHLYSLLRQKNHPVRRWRQTKKWNQLLPLLCNAANSIIWTPIHHKNASSQKR